MSIKTYWMLLSIGLPCTNCTACRKKAIAIARGSFKEYCAVHLGTKSYLRHVSRQSDANKLAPVQASVETEKETGPMEGKTPPQQTGSVSSSGRPKRARRSRKPAEAEVKEAPSNQNNELPKRILTALVITSAAMQTS